MHHKVTTSEGKLFNRPVHAQCACGTAGDFRTVEEGRAWFESQHFPRLGGVSSFEFVAPLASAPEEVVSVGDTETASPAQTEVWDQKQPDGASVGEVLREAKAKE